MSTLPIPGSPSTSQRAVSGWRVLAGFVVTYLLAWAITTAWGLAATRIANWLFPGALTRATLGSLVTRGGILLIQIAIWIAATRFFLRRRLLADLAFPPNPRWWADLLAGIGLSTLAMLAVFAVEASTGWLTIEGWAWRALERDAWLSNLWLGILTCMIAAVGEEILFRGYLLAGLKESWGAAAGVVISSLIFVLPHLLVSGAAETPWLLFVPMLALAGIMLSYAYVRTGSLWLPIGIHFAWNFVQGALITPTDESRSAAFAAITVLRGPAWMVGTGYGLEVGLVDLLPLGIVIGGTWLWTRQGKRGSGR